MKKPLRVLLVEDKSEDAALVERSLGRGGFAPEIHRVDTRARFVEALARGEWDVVISDYRLPSYDGMAALEDLRASERDIPFILVSGTVGEALAVEVMKAGAQDYVLKDHLTRLASAVEREVEEARVRAERRRMRDQLVISERMASAGTLAAGVAHEINNPLAVAIANVDYLSGLLNQITADLAKANGAVPSAVDKRIREFGEPLEDIHEALERIRAIVRDVKIFSRPHAEQGGPVEVRRVVESSVRLAWNEIRHRAALIKEYGATPMAAGNEARLGQVVLNLIVNAAQAMPPGDASRNEIRIRTRTASDGRVLVEVSDTGSGISKENLARIFDPFFTTKRVGEGTGLGLAICRRIVLDLGGTLEVESELGKGTTFRLALPPAPPDMVASTPPTSPPPSARRARVLVIDDELTVGRAIQRSLGRTHDVTSLTSGREALDRIHAGERFDVILSDLMMPDVTGMDIYADLETAAPDQAERMVFVTGGAFTERAASFLGEVPNKHIEKPFDVDNLQGIIAQLLA